MFTKKEVMEIKEINDEDIEFVNYAFGLINSAKYPSFQKVTETYNKIFGTSLSNTSCAQCVRQRVLDMKREVDKLMQRIDEKENEKNSDTMIGV